MGCLFSFGKFTVLFVTIAVVFTLFAGALTVDMVLVMQEKEPYFFDPKHIDAYDEPMLDDIYQDLLSNYHKNSDAIRNIEKDLIALPANQSLEVVFGKGSEVDISASYMGGYKYESPFDYRAAENQKFLQQLGVTPETLDQLKQKVKAVNCISFEKEAGIRLGFKEDKDGTFYYRYKVDLPEDISILIDSCLIRTLNKEMLIEYKGSGRGPDCIKSDNPEGYDDRGFLRKWYDLLTKDGKLIFKN